MRLSRTITGWAFLASVGDTPQACLAIGLDSVSPFTTGSKAGGSLFVRAHSWWGLPALASLNDLPFNGQVNHRWCVTQDDRGVLSVLTPDGDRLAEDLDLDRPAGWQSAADGSGSVVLIVSHVFPLTEDPLSTLAFEARNGLVCAGRVRFGQPVPLAADKPTARLIFDAVGWLTDLTYYVTDQIMSLDEAKRRARELAHTQQALADHHASSGEAMLDILFRDGALDRRSGVELTYVYWRLVAEVADVCRAETAWHVAALRAVESAVDLVAERGDIAVFTEADAVSRRMMAELSDPAGLAAAMAIAARLRIATRGPEDLADDLYARGQLTTWSARFQADLYRTWFTDEEPFQSKSPGLVSEAAQLLAQALELGNGRQSPRLLASLAQLVSDEEGARQNAARAALATLLNSPALSEPDLALFLLRVVNGVPQSTVNRLTSMVFGTPLDDFVAFHGNATTSKAISQGVNLARERTDRELLRTVLEWAEQFDNRWGSARRRQLIEARLHVLPDDLSDCPSPGQQLAASFPDEWTSAQRVAASLHAAAHARDRQESSFGITLLRQVGGVTSEEVRLLTADLYLQAAKTGEPIPGPVPFPWGYYMYAALSYASLGFEELAQASLVPFAQQLGNLRGDELKIAIYTILVDLPNFDTSSAPELSEVLRDLLHTAVWQLAAEIETLPMGLMLGLHHAGKGPELGAWQQIDGPLALPGHIQHLIGRLMDLEQPASPGSKQANLLDTLEAERRRPAGHHDDDIVRNLRWRISSLIDSELRRRSGPLVDEQHLWATAHNLLDERTVLLTWFLPAFVSGAAVLLAITRQGRHLVVHLGDGAEESNDRHPVADLVEAIRAEVERDPLFSDVTQEGKRLLKLGDTLLGGSDQWHEWHAQGKDRVLVWPHGALHYLPFPLCSAGDRLIADDWTVTTIASLDALSHTKGPTRERRTAVLASASGGLPFGLHVETALEEHAREIAEAIGADEVTGAAATRARLLAELSTADIVHIAAHGTSDQDAPWMHCLFLTADDEDDGRVFAFDFLEIDLRGVRLVTLAACESALGRFDRADNVRGIPSALVTAGAQAVVGCLWPVRPEPATFFYHHMHLRVANGSSPEQAFRDAQLATRARHPHYRDWGAFTYLHGRSEGAK